MVFSPKLSLEYLDKKPKRIHWQIVAGPKLHPIQMSDVVFDEYDWKMRGL